MTDETTKKIFISYSRKDKKWKDLLVKHLEALEWEGRLTVWDDSRIKPGDHWRTELDTALDEAAAAVLPVSPDFLISPFIREEEIPRLLERRENEKDAREHMEKAREWVETTGYKRREKEIINY